MGEMAFFNIFHSILQGAELLEIFVKVRQRILGAKLTFFCFVFKYIYRLMPCAFILVIYIILNLIQLIIIEFVLFIEFVHLSLTSICPIHGLINHLYALNMTCRFDFNISFIKETTRICFPYVVIITFYITQLRFESRLTVFSHFLLN